MGAEQRESLRPSPRELQDSTRKYFDGEITQQYQEIKWGPSKRVDSNSQQGMLYRVTRDYFDGKVSLDRYVDVSWGILDGTRAYPVSEVPIQETTTLVKEEPVRRTLLDRVRKPIDVFIARLRG